MAKKTNADAALEQAIEDQTLRDEIGELELSLARTRQLRRKDKAALTAAMKRLERLQAEFEFLQVVEAPKRALNRIAKGHKRSGSRDATAVFVASDWHVEETVTLAETDGQNEYNLAIAEDRIERFFQGIVSMVESWTTGSHAAEIRDIVVPLIGDLMNGYLREDDLISNSLTPPQAVTWLSQRLVDGFEYLLRHLDVHILVPCRTGNHGRLMALSNRRTMWAMKESMSLESLIYQMVAAQFQGEKRLSFDVPDAGIATYIDVKGVRFRFMHGDTIRYGGGIGGLTVPLVKALHRMDQQNHADMTVLGHFHQTLWLSNASVNGSMIGTNAYATAGGFTPERPQQSAILVRKNRGVDCRQSIWLDK